MKKLFIFMILALFLFSSFSYATLTGQEAHEKYVYPVVRVSDRSGTGSGTIVYSFPAEADTKAVEYIFKGYSTYVLTNFHVVRNSIKITEEWDTKLQKNMKKERRSVVYVEIFKYKDMSTPVGTMKIEADIVLYDKIGDMALLKLRLDEKVDHVATLPERDNTKFYRIMDESVASGCSLGWPTLVSVGVITRLNFQIDSLPYDMSSAQIIFGNSGGAMFSAEGIFMGIPSRIAMAGWSAVVTHMGAFIPVHRIFDWFTEEYYDFIFDDSLREVERLEEREESIEAAKKAEM